MKLLVATGIYPPDIGGPATYSKLLHDELPKRGFAVEILSFGEVRHLPKIVRHIVYAAKLFRRAWSVDVIFAQDTVSVGMPALWVSRILGKKLFVRVPGDHAWEQATQRYRVTDSIDEFQNKKYGWQVELLRKIQRATVNGAHTVIAPSVYFRDLVSKWMKNPDNAFCIYNGIDLSDIPESAGSYEPKTIISAGRLVPWKGFAQLVALMTHLPGWKLSIAGDGDVFRKKLEHTIKEKNLTDRVTLLGQVPRQQLVKKIQGSEVFVLNTSFESFSFQVVEAMASGTPVITTSVGNLAEIIDDGVNGFLVSPRDAKEILGPINLLGSKEIRQKIVSEAKKKAQKFSIQNTLDSLVILLQRP